MIGDVNAIPLGERPKQEQKKPAIELDAVPDVEWWDARFLKNPKVSSCSWERMILPGCQVSHACGTSTSFHRAAPPFSTALCQPSRKHNRGYGTVQSHIAVIGMALPALESVRAQVLRAGAALRRATA